MSYEILVLPKAQRQIKELPSAVQKRISAAVRALKDNPRPPGVRKLADVEDLYRLRVGEYRVIYGVGDKVLVVVLVTVGHRRDVYEKLLKKHQPRILRALLEKDKGS